MTVNPRFINYFRETFFSEKPEELVEFLSSLEKGIPRTIRIRPGKEKEVKTRIERYGFTLEETYIPNVFVLGRTEDFDPLERRIGYTVDHLVGNFYIQELAAATSVHILSEGKIHEDDFVILDMAASPGGKTTQLSEMYPNSFIIANEPTRERIPQLLQNLDRMGSANIGVTLYPGQYFTKTPETFDRILLDAPCSGEGTLYKGTDATKHWHIKNIKTIARLQEKLIHAAIIALKVG
jgi:16S rRNA (cytosine1407-C5)-methyltransferase